MLQAVSGRQAAHATPNNHHVMSSRSRRSREYEATFIADLVANVVVFAMHVCRMVFLRVGRLRFPQREIHRTTSGHCSCDNKFDEVPAVCTHNVVPPTDSTTSMPASVPRSRMRKRYQTTIATNENTKIIVETALISGVIPRRNRPQISRGSVLSRPIRKKLTAISSMESVKISSAAPMIDSFKFGIVTRQNVCQ